MPDANGKVEGPMLLAIDAGNTNVVFALVNQTERGSDIVARWRIATDPRRTADEYAVWLSQLMQLGGHDRSTRPSCRARCTIFRSWRPNISIPRH
jgi:pantothenate kinase type III